jgi:hypothetical protein
MSPGSLEENIKIVALINRKNKRIEIFLVESEDIKALEIDLYEYDIDFDKELAELAKEHGIRVAILGFDEIVEAKEEGEE